MSKCDVTVCLDGTARSFMAGDGVTGTVVVTANTEVAATKLIVEQLWRVHGRGNTFEKVVAEDITMMPDLTGGLPREHRFRFSAPAHPVSYHGNLINVDHYVRVRVDLPMAIDPTAEVDYVVAPGTASAEAYVLDKTAVAAQGKSSGCGKIIGWILLPVLVPLFVVLLAMVLPILLVVALVVFVRRHLAEKRLGQVTVEIGAPTITDKKPYSGPGVGLLRKFRPVAAGTVIVKPGQVIPVTLRFMPTADINLNGAQLKLEAKEHATSGSGTDATTYNHTVWSQTVAMIEPRPFLGGQPVEVVVRMLLPQTDAYSLDVSNNRIAWIATVRIDVPGWADWVRDHDLLMIPGP